MKMSYLRQYATENISRVLSWSAESSSLLQVHEVVEWSIGVPSCSTFRVNTLTHTVDEVIQYIRDILSKEYQSEKVELPRVTVHHALPECIVIDRLNIHDLDLVPKPNEIIVDSKCGTAVLRGSDVFAPGVMAMPSGTKIGSEVSVYADLAKSCLRGYKQPYLNEKKLFVGNGVVVMNRHQLFDNGQQTRGVAIKMKYPTSGLVMVNCPKKYGVLQNLPSMVCVRALNPKPGDIVLDMCAAPGNKTSHIATLMNDEGTLIAIDKKSRIHLIKLNCSAMNIRNCVHIFAGDSRRLVGEIGRNILAGPPFSPESFDRILLDACCSGLGNRPMLNNMVQTERRLLSFSEIQKSLIRSAVPLVKRGGMMVYSTCSIMCEENECVVAWLLENHPEMKLVAAEPLIGGPGLPNCGLNDKQRILVQRFGPGVQPEDSIGFFIAKFEKS